MISERAPGWEERRYDLKGGTEILVDAMAGSWKIKWTQDNKRREAVIVLKQDGTCAPPRESDECDEEAKQGSNMLFGEWKLKGEDINIFITRHAGDACDWARRKVGVTVFGRSAQVRLLDDRVQRIHSKRQRPSVRQASISMVKESLGCCCALILTSPTDPVWLGKFRLEQLLGKASVGMGPGEAPKVESRASQGFALGGRSDQKVLKRFCGPWEANINMDSTRISCTFGEQGGGCGRMCWKMHCGECPESLT
ncbi:hypothetical protein GUITHDRAFT_166895 [Guillardia theta CCMP2712]|uniref:Uncharacterized protein n=1 Tax=Guillardia theta (strain CCMP2712) TaxID=905079 RepID=L1I539_GUITC|nr:hypothetical protein GUITHDRAFT_166895 [Guillardia theta CCMP2712]EKX31378.1 hypothetical protein GUITHDRAFT_166895 [Guillardia theta CCMP2712]|eukprot:XP_005818358.1 hypothetical protein GUITHDRAFT_166895 [Guillardia theta CCMP2712]